jgi:hypothetical protein
MAEIKNEMLQLGVYALLVRGEGKDLLMGTNVQNYIKLPGLEALLHQFIVDLDAAFEFIYENNIDRFLSQLENRFSIDLNPLKENLTNNITQMRALESDDIMIYYLVITKTLEYIRNHVFQSQGREWIRDTYKKLKKETPDPAFLEELECIDSACNVDYSLLYNLVFIHHLAQVYQNQSMQEKTTRLIQKSIDNMIKDITG